MQSSFLIRIGKNHYKSSIVLLFISEEYQKTIFLKSFLFIGIQALILRPEKELGELDKKKTLQFIDFLHLVPLKKKSTTDKFSNNF